MPPQYRKRVESHEKEVLALFCQDNNKNNSQKEHSAGEDESDSDLEIVGVTEGRSELAARELQKEEVKKAFPHKLPKLAQKEKIPRKETVADVFPDLVGEDEIDQLNAATVDNDDGLLQPSSQEVPHSAAAVDNHIINAIDLDLAADSSATLLDDDAPIQWTQAMMHHKDEFMAQLSDDKKFARKLQEEADRDLARQKAEEEASLFVAEQEEQHRAAIAKHCDPLQQSAVQYVVKKCYPQSNAAIAPLKERAAILGYADDDLTKCKEYIRDVAPLIIHLNLEEQSRLRKMLDDSHYRNQFEVKMSKGHYTSDHEHRKAWESQLFNGIYDAATPYQRPKYGVLNIVNDPAGIESCKCYGDSYFVLKNVRYRTSFANADSSAVSRDSSFALATVEYYNHVLCQYTDAEFHAVMSVALGRTKYQRSSVIKSYKEVQYHGEIFFPENIELLVVADRHAHDPAIMKLVREFCEKNRCPHAHVSELEESYDAN